MSDKSANVSQPRDYRMIIEKDVPIPMRDGTILYGDLYRPDGGDERFPVIMNIGPYQKDKVWIPPESLEEQANPYMNWETANPLWWCPRGYALLRVDSRGSGKSPGQSEVSSYQESLDAYDAIEWVARCPWCNSNVGTLGISYHANFQWRVAGLQPPSLKAIMPWEGRGRSIPRPSLPRGHFGHRVHGQLVGKPSSSPPAWPIAKLQSRRLQQQSVVDLHAQ